jgi:hypothetical protein
MKLKAFHKQYTNYIVLIFIIGGYAVFFWLNTIFSAGQTELCIFKNVTGIPCPGCGMGRGTIELFHGHLLAGLRMHPLSIPFNAGILTAIFFLVKDIMNKESRFMEFMKQKPPRVTTIILSMIVVVVWWWNIYRGI